ncbi:MAG: hypothetical protein IPG64_19350 [Haliea sp.]|nr:hypothetical protein [Haliea sp.]
MGLDNQPRVASPVRVFIHDIALAHLADHRHEHRSGGDGCQRQYVVEADGANFSTESIADGAGFDFVAQDFGIEATEAIQITLDNLSRATNLRAICCYGRSRLQATLARRYEEEGMIRRAD